MTAAPTIADPFVVFGIGRGPDGAKPVMTQRLGTGVTDHRGLIELGALTVLFDDIGGLPFYYADVTSSSMQARLSMSMMERPAIDEVLTAGAQLQLRNDLYGSTSVTISGRDDRMLCIGTARNVRVGRDVVSGADSLEIPQAAAPQAPVAPPLDPALSGAEIVAGLRDGTVPVGPFAELLGGSVVAVGESGAVTTEFTARPWMANLMGTMHGGVIAAMLAQASSFGAQNCVRPGNDYQLVDFTCEFHRSPAVDGRSVRVVVEPVKLGRRLSIFDARMYDGEQLLARATADARFDV